MGTTLTLETELIDLWTLVSFEANDDDEKTLHLLGAYKFLDDWLAHGYCHEHILIPKGTRFSIEDIFYEVTEDLHPSIRFCVNNPEKHEGKPWLITEKIKLKQS